MSGRDRPISNAMGKIKDKIMKTVQDVDNTRDPEYHGYQRVQGGNGTLSTSTTATSLDTMAMDDSSALLPLPPPPSSHNASGRQRSPMRQQQQQQQRQQQQQLPSNTKKYYQTSTQQSKSDELSRAFSPLLEGDDINEPETGIIQKLQNPSLSTMKKNQSQQIRSSSGIIGGDYHKSSKQSIKGSRVSFENPPDSSDEDSFEDKRDQFQQTKAVSVDHKGILKDLKSILATDNRRLFQSKKHVSLDVKSTRFLEDLLKESSSEEEFHNNRKDFQSRKHQSLDPRVNFKLEKDTTTTSSSDDEGGDFEKKSLIHDKFKDITKPVIIDLKDFDSENEDYIATRKSFQQQRSISIESRKSHRIFEMDDMSGSKKSENLRNAVPYVRQITEDGKPKLEVYQPTTNPIYIYTQILAALSVSLGSMVVGFASAYTSPALVSMTNPNITSFSVSEQESSWVGGLMPLAGLAGGVCGGPFIEILGRKNTILGTAIPFIISWLLIACAVNVAMVLAGRALAGFCVGIASLSLPVYLGETIQPEVRGTLGLLPTAFGNIGILVCFVAGKYMDWSMLAFLGGALPVPFLILMFLIPETPRWYVSRGREDHARKALVWLRGKYADIEPELKGLMRSHTEAEKHANSTGVLQLLKRSNLKPLVISLGLMFFQQLSGINAVIFYTVSIFKDAGSTIDENLCTIIVGIVNFIATFIATMLIDRLGRKILLYISDVAMIITLFTLGGFFYAKENNVDVSSIGWLPLASFVIFVIGFSLGFGPIPWLMMGEILPARIRGSAASVATAFNWACTFVVTKTFADLKQSIGPYGAFWLFGSICFIGLFFVIFYVPETQGKTLEEIERKMMGRVRRMSSVANIKPLSFNM